MATNGGVACRGLVVSFMLIAPTGLWAEPRCSQTDFSVASVGSPPQGYIDFCLNNERACVLEGDSLISWTPDVRARIDAINTAVNAEIAFVSDSEALGLEDEWNYPRNCKGDCEDIALEKRRRLVAAGFPSASLTMATVFHEVQFFPHAVLLVESSKGTWVLDNFYDSALCWDAVPYIFTGRERPDGQWARFMLP